MYLGKMQTYSGDIDQKMFDKIMKEHRKFVRTGGKEGKHATFKKARFRSVKFARKKLARVYFEFCVFDESSCNFCGADLKNSSFDYCVFFKGEFIKSHLKGTTFKTCMLNRANFEKANAESCEFCSCQCIGANFVETKLMHSEFILCGMQAAEFYYADVENAKFYSCCLTGCEFVGALNMDEMDWNMFTTDLYSVCPKKGSFIGYKKALILDKNEYYAGRCIVKLEIPDDAKRSNATTRKCRCNKAKVLGFYDYDGNELPCPPHIVSMYDEEFEYKRGEIMEVDDFDDCAMKECAAGIHFFMTFEEAVEY